MTRKLLLVMEYGFKNSEKISRVELWRGNHFTVEEWTCRRRFNSWRHVGETLHRDDLKSGLEAFGWYVYSNGIENAQAVPRGIGACGSVEKETRDQLTAQVDQTLLEIYEFDDNYHEDDTPVLYYAYVGVFSTKLPRGAVGDGCWAVQFAGLQACKNCEFDDSQFCLGRETVLTGRNSLGLEIPILEQLL